MSDPLDKIVSAYADTYELLATATTGRTRRGPDGTVLSVSGSPVPDLNAIISFRAEPDAEVIAALADSETWDCAWSIHVRGEPGPEVTEVAARRGLSERHRQPLMVRDASRGPVASPVIDSLRVRPVASDEWGRYAAAVAEGFEAPAGVFDVFAAPALGRVDGFTFYLAELDGALVGTGMIAVVGGLTGVYNITTFPEFRRRGYGLAVTTAMVRAGAAAGATTAYLYASEAGVSVYEKAGFRTREYLTILTAPSSGA